MILSVQHFCLHDGPGLRSVVFLKGCPLRCEWCQNPESWEPAAQLAHRPHLCIECFTCVHTCPEKAMLRPGRWDPGRCTLCFRCVERCPSGALVRYGEDRAADAVLDELRAEYPFMRRSGGGVTFSGGEPTLRAEYVAEVAGALRNDGVHTAIETCGLFSYDQARGMLSEIDLVLFDVKVFDREAHKKACGADNRRIKSNLETLAHGARTGQGPAVWPRLPLIPGMTDGKDSLTAWARMLVDLGLRSMSVVPYHRLGEPKREWLGADPPPAIDPLTDDALAIGRATLEAEGITTFLPGEERWDEPALRIGPRIAS